MVYIRKLTTIKEITESLDALQVLLIDSKVPYYNKGKQSRIQFLCLSIFLEPKSILVSSLAL